MPRHTLEFQRLCRLIDAMPEVALLVSRQAAYLYCNQRLADYLGCPRENIEGQPVKKFYPPEIATVLLYHLEQVFSTGLPAEFEIERQGRTHKTRIYPLTDRNGAIDCAMVMAADVTIHRQAAAAALFNELRYRELCNNLQIGVAVYQAQGNGDDFVIVAFNPAAERIDKVKREEVLGKSLKKVFPGVVKFGLFAVLKRVFNTGSPEHMEAGIYKDGRISGWRENYVCRLPSGEVVAMYQDLDKEKAVEGDLKRAQEDLLQAGKMVAIGELAAGIAHELNQPLTGIKGFAQTMLLDLPQDSPLRADLEHVIEQADRMDAIIGNVRMFARKSEMAVKPMDVNQPIEAALMLLQEQFRVHNIALGKDLAEGLPLIEADLNQMQQVFVNLITNARDAIFALNDRSRGRITVRTCLSEDKANVEVYVIDDGCGIPDDLKDKIFKPFFTTKSAAGGMGLGVPIVCRIMESLKGTVSVDSSAGKGTTVKLAIPRSN